MSRTKNRSMHSSMIEIPDSEILIYLRELEKPAEAVDLKNVPMDFKQSLLEIANNSAMLEACKRFLQIAPKKVADIFCGQVEKVLTSFVTNDASWGKEQRKETGSLLIGAFALYRVMVEHLDKPPLSIFRRLLFFHNSIFIIQRHADHEPLIKTFFTQLVDLCELWFLKKRSTDAYKLLPNLIVILLAQKLTLASLTRLNSWSDYWHYFKIEPLSEHTEIRDLFRDLPREDWEEDTNSTVSVEKPLTAILEVEKVPYLADAVLAFMTSADIGGKSAGKTTIPPLAQKARKFLATLLSVNPDFVRLARLAIDNIMSSDSGARKNDQLNGFADVIVQTWSTLRKAEDPVRADLEAFIISDLMRRSLNTDPNHKKNFLNKYRLMVCSMYYENDVAARAMFHRNFDDMVLDGVTSSNDLVKANSLVMLGKCFPMVAPDASKKERLKLTKDQAGMVVANLKSVKHHLRAAAVLASGHVIGRGWTLLDIKDRAEILRQVCERLVYDASSPEVRLAAVQATMQFLDQPLAHHDMLPFLAGMKDVATDEMANIRLEYYHLLLKALELKLDMNSIWDMGQMLAHYLERDRPYAGVIGSILDVVIWKVEDKQMKQFLRVALDLFEKQPAVASKCFQNMPKGKKADEISRVILAIFSQVFNAVAGETSIVQPGDTGSVNVLLELAGTIWAASVLELGKDQKLNKEIQLRAIQLLRKLKDKHDTIYTVNLYRIACRLPLQSAENTDPNSKTVVQEYQEYCLDDLMATENIEEGVTLMSFINVWGCGRELIRVVEDWLEKETGSRKKVPSDERRAHLGLQYLSMSLSDPDISGHFESLEKEVEKVTLNAADLFMTFLPKRFARKFEPTDALVEDGFFCVVPVLMSLCWLNRMRYEMDCTNLQAKFQQLIVKLKEHVFELVGLGKATNVVYALEHYKLGAEIRKSDAVLLADSILKIFKGIVAEIVDIAKTDDEELHLQLRGYKSDQPVQLTLVTPPDVEPVAKKAKTKKAAKAKKAGPSS